MGVFLMLSYGNKLQEGIIMLSKRKEYRDEIYEICQKSGDVNVNDHFTGVIFSESALYD